MVLCRDFYDRDTVTVARELLGKHLGLLTNQVKLEAVPVIISGGELLED